MKNILLLILLIVGTQAFSQTAEAEKVNQLHRKKFDWLINRKYDSLNWLMDDRVKYIHSNGWIQSKAEVVDDLNSGKLNYTSVVVEESSVSYFNQSAVVTGKGIFKGLMTDKSEFAIHLLYTEVYVRQKKQWKLVSRQATKI
ncbi:MAG TPA: nuclear transport factor 2 family protein [Cyclobacteriaceae bacterium]|nr:nuclear transport factor 2 family protein [Cyclobacteriaceae bacterium]